MVSTGSNAACGAVYAKMNADPNSSLAIRDVLEHDLEQVLRINEAVVPAVNSIDIEQMRWFTENAAYFRVAGHAGKVSAFLIGMRPGTSYQSPNYLWFCEAYEDFGYIDRVAVDTGARRFGLATRMYEDFESSLPATVDVLTCEVNIHPPNESSMRFHERFGFRQVGSQHTDGGTKRVALMEKERQL